MNAIFEQLPEHFVKGVCTTVLSINYAAIAWISLQSMQFYFAIGASLIAGLSGLFACRYYWYATEEKKLTIENLKSNNKNEQ